LRKTGKVVGIEVQTPSELLAVEREKNRRKAAFFDLALEL
jgi:uncharacterized protein YuzE